VNSHTLAKEYRGYTSSGKAHDINVPVFTSSGKAHRCVECNRGYTSSGKAHEVVVSVFTSSGKAHRGQLASVECVEVEDGFVNDSEVKHESASSRDYSFLKNMKGGGKRKKRDGSRASNFTKNKPKDDESDVSQNSENEATQKSNAGRKKIVKPGPKKKKAIVDEELDEIQEVNESSEMETNVIEGVETSEIAVDETVSAQVVEPMQVENEVVPMNVVEEIEEDEEVRRYRENPIAFLLGDCYEELRNNEFNEVFNAYLILQDNMLTDFLNPESYLDSAAVINGCLKIFGELYKTRQALEEESRISIVAPFYFSEFIEKEDLHKCFLTNYDLNQEVFVIVSDGGHFTFAVMKVEKHGRKGNALAKQLKCNFYDSLRFLPLLRDVRNGLSES
jgi:hypothetical protein